MDVKGSFVCRADDALPVGADGHDDIGALQEAYSTGRVHPSAVIAACQENIRKFDGLLRAFIEQDAEVAEAAARESDNRFKCGTTRSLEGVPMAVKANLAVEGFYWNAGTALFRERKAECDATAVRRLREAGAVILGTLNMHEAAIGGTSHNPWWGRVRNPHGLERDLSLSPGGSSGGSAAATAAGFCMAALGTDTMGSVRLPAAFCGLYGLIPTHGKVPSDGLEPLNSDFDTIGVMTRSLADLVRLIEVLAHPLPELVHGPYRLILLKDDHFEDCQPAVMAGYLKALAALPSSTATLDLPLVDIRSAAFLASARRLAEHLDPCLRPEEVSEDLLWLLEHGRDAPDMSELIGDARHKIRAEIGTDGVLLTPTTPCTAFPLGAPTPDNVADFTTIANVGGLPALSMPAGSDERGLPIAVQLIGPPNGERLLLELAGRLDPVLGGRIAPAWPPRSQV